MNTIWLLLCTDKVLQDVMQLAWQILGSIEQSCMSEYGVISLPLFTLAVSVSANSVFMITCKRGMELTHLTNR